MLEIIARKKKESELKNVEAARYSLEVRMLELQDSMKRLEDQIKQQLDAEERIKQELKNLP